MKYLDLVKAWADDRERIAAHQAKVAELLDLLYKELKTQLNVSPMEVKELLYWSPPDKPVVAGKNYTARGALRLREDGQVSVDLVFHLREDPATFPQAQVTTHIHVRRSRSWVFKVDGVGSEHPVSFDHPTKDLPALADAITKAVHDCYAGKFDRWLKGDRKPFGFTIAEEDE